MSHHSHLYFNANFLSDKIALLANQIAGFFIVQYLQKVVRDQVGFYMEIEIKGETIILVWVARHV